MLEFAGTDESRPQTIGHVEMVHTLDGKDTIICGHGSGRPSYKDMIAYCRQRQNTKASTKRGNKGLVCVRRYLLDDAVPELSLIHILGPCQTEGSVGWYQAEGPEAGTEEERPGAGVVMEVKSWQCLSIRPRSKS